MYTIHTLNMQNFVCTQFCLLNVHKFFQIIYTILYIQGTQIFKECMQFCIFKIYKILKNIHNSIHSTYTISQRMYIILYIQGTQFFFKMYTILNIQYIQIFNFVHSRNTIFKQCTQFCI